MVFTYDLDDMIIDDVTVNSIWFFLLHKTNRFIVAVGLYSNR